MGPAATIIACGSRKSGQERFMKKALYSILFLAISLAVLVSGCVISPRRNSVNHGATGKLYVATAGGILRFGGALQATGKAPPQPTPPRHHKQPPPPPRPLLQSRKSRPRPPHHRT